MTIRPRGWYQDPWDPSLRRLWDGQGWTHHTQAPALQDLLHTIGPLNHAPAPVQPSHPAETQSAKASNNQVIVGFTLAIVSLFFAAVPVNGTLLTLAATIFSTVGLIRQTPEMGKKYLVLGIIGVAIGLIYTFGSVIILMRFFNGELYI
ncbi:DUF2510 domain-containing protein [Arthrobacter sp. I2-34]|uniref:DUF2510 domain-containing protein n=1 Tax=Arthrobacter hankyongi TaxID=2904801 RepID=A0ABS9L7Y8_9MICC|nr:DUF2510 domain-containing protein [Arthrobacter hankyongi]MCG2622693.1 DUF2510 domain-containing protein [Arthrobacter hankyongi]